MLALALLLGLVSCRHGYRPERPVTSMYPTIFPASQLDSFVSRRLSLEELQAILDKSGVSGELAAAGFLDTDRAIILRGLEKHGYAEIDCRRCRLPWLWIAFSVQSGQQLVLACGYEKLPHGYEQTAAGQPGLQVYRMAANGREERIDCYNPVNGDETMALFRVYQPGDDTAVSHWEVVRLFLLGDEP